MVSGGSVEVRVAVGELVVAGDSVAVDVAFELFNSGEKVAVGAPAGADVAVEVSMTGD